MKRRTLLAGIATGTIGLAGCLAEGVGSDGDDTDGEGDSSGDDDGDGSGGKDDGPPTVEGSSIETIASDCGSTDAVEAMAERGHGAVTVEGVIGAPNPCHRAVLEEADVRDQQLVLRVDVERRGEACRSCIGEIEYEATVTVANVYALQGTLVEHVDGEEHGTDWGESANAS